MKKLLLLAATIWSLGSCGKKHLSYDEQRLAEWGLSDKKDFILFGVPLDDLATEDGKVAILGFYQKKLWVGLYDSESRKKIWEAVSSERMDTSYEKTEYGVTTTAEIVPGSFKPQIVDGRVIVDVNASSTNGDPYFKNRHIIFENGKEKKVIFSKGMLLKSYSGGFYEVYEAPYGEFPRRRFSYFNKNLDSVYTIGCVNFGITDYWQQTNGIQGPKFKRNIPFLPNDDFLIPSGYIVNYDEKDKANFVVANVKNDLRLNNPPGQYETKFRWGYDKDPEAKFVSQSFRYTNDSTLIITLYFVLKNNSTATRRVEMNATTLEWKYLD